MDLTGNMLHWDWLNLSTHLLWCYDDRLLDRTHSETTEACSNSGAWLVCRGHATVEHDGQHYEAGPGEWLIAKPTKRVQRFSPDTQLLSLAFSARWPDGAHWLSEGLSVVLNADSHPALERKAKPLVRTANRVAPGSWNMLQHRMDYREHLRLESLLASWLSALVTALEAHGITPANRAGIDPRTMQAFRILNAHPLGERPDYQQLAADVGLSLAQLTRLFHAHLDSTPRGLFEQRRLEYACRCLRVPGTRVKVVAYDLGFCHFSHFSAWFKKQTGQSPRSFARR